MTRQHCKIEGIFSSSLGCRDIFHHSGWISVLFVYFWPFATLLKGETAIKKRWTKRQQ